MEPVLFFLAPGPYEPSFGLHYGPDWAALATIALAAAGTLGGLGWMIRIYRADPEPDQAAWRYRAPRD
jgi:hypothetical protein